MRTELRHTTSALALLGLLGLLAAGACSTEEETATPTTTVTTADGGGATTTTTTTDTTSGSGGTTNTGGGTSAGGSDGGASVGGALPTDSSIIFLHHSTGGVVWGGGVESAFGTYNTDHATAYAITALDYPDGTNYGWQNYPYDYWHFWVDGDGHADDYSHLTIEELTTSYDVVIFKHCYPVSGIEADTGSPDITSQSKTIENYKLQYDALKPRLQAFTDNRFIVWTGAALVASASSAEQGARAREFFTWVKEEWDEPGDNIFVWDFFELETEGENFLLDQYAAGAGDSHPSGAFAATVAPYFVQRIVDVIEGRGDIGSLTGQ